MNGQGEDKVVLNHGLVHGFILDGNGGGRQVDWKEVEEWTPEQGILWLHLDYTNERTQEWVRSQSGLDEIPAEALLTEETRPRTIMLGEGALIALRGVNLNPESDPEDMVSLRLWIDSHKIISTRKRRLLSVRDIATSLEQGIGPRNPGEFIVHLADCLTNRMRSTIEGIDDRLAEIEDQILDNSNLALRNELLDLRRTTIMLRRYLAPQREALSKLHLEKLPWMSSDDRIGMHEVTDALIRYLEDLDSARDRASVTQEELVNRLAEQMNVRMYVLTIAAAIFLPLGFLTGLLGINVGGIPGADNKWAFLIFVLMLVAVVVLQLLYFKRKKWL